jgi:hypothetical protein
VTLPRLASLLAEHGLTGVAEDPLVNAGYSGSALSRLVRADGAAFVLKRMSIERDWIMRATDDEECREAAFAEVAHGLRGGVRVPDVRAARDGDEFALLMDDITARMLPEGRVTATQLDTIITRMAELHATAAPDGVPWCDQRKRLLLLTPGIAAIAQAYGAPVARDLIEGWRQFERHASPGARAVIGRLTDEPAPLLGALGTLPAAFLHGDLKFDNIGLDGEGRMWLIDWAMTLVAPPAVELGWFLAINSRRLPQGVGLDAVLGRYADTAGIRGELRARQDALAVTCGLLLRGWRKGLDAEEGEAEELRWWCERVEAAARYLDVT